MSLLDAVRRMVKSYPGGRDAVALRLGKSPEVLRKELSAADPHHKFGLLDALEIQAMCLEVHAPDARALVLALAAEAGGTFVPHAAAVDVPSGQVMRAMADEVRGSSTLNDAVVDALDDDRVTDRELDKIEADALEQMMRVTAVVHACRAKNAKLRERDPLRGGAVVDWPAQAPVSKRG